MESRQRIRFILNSETIELTECGASDSLLDFIRLSRRLTGTKEGCAEGDCGACTVLVGRICGEELIYEPVNACIRFLATLDGCHVVTIEHLAGAGATLHPVQQAMVEFHGAQCGFCTPGIVMALYALWMRNADPSAAEIETALQGNLCRCTGYAPIIRAAKAACGPDRPRMDHLTRERDAIFARLSALRDGARVEVGRGDSRCILPASVDDVAEILAIHPDATLVAGATDVGLWVTKFLRDISPAVFIGHLDALRQLSISDNQIRIGAGASYEECRAALVRAFPFLQEYWDRIAGWQIRSQGTIGGNIANGSPIGDTPPVLIALGAMITLRQGSSRRELPLEAFFIDYGQQDLRPGEFVECITIPTPQNGALYAAYKISKRRDEDISALAAAFHIRLDGNLISEARIAFGGMAATPKRAHHAEAMLRGQVWSEATMLQAASVLDQDFTPLSDMRASAEYRMLAARNLFRRFWLDQQGGEASIRLERVAPSCSQPHDLRY